MSWLFRYIAKRRFNMVDVVSIFIFSSVLSGHSNGYALIPWFVLTVVSTLMERTYFPEYTNHHGRSSSHSDP